MAKIYISYSQADSDLAIALGDELRSRGHELAIDLSLLTPGTDWREALNTALKTADALVALITRNSLESQFVISEIGAARAFAKSSGQMLVLPVIADDIPVPAFISDIQAILAPSRDIKHIADEVDRAVASLVGIRAAREQQQVAQKEQLERDAAPYVDEAIASLTRNEKRDRWIAYAWFVGGSLVLVAGVAYALWSLQAAVTTQLVPATTAEVSNAWIRFAWVALKTLVVVGLLLAASKYCFLLGRSHMSESLKSADRIHAISYGRFYLRAWGGREAPPQMKDVFQHWNISSPSAFAETTPEQFDPKYLEQLIALAKLVAGKGEEK